MQKYSNFKKLLDEKISLSKEMKGPIDIQRIPFRIIDQYCKMDSKNNGISAVGFIFNRDSINVQPDYPVGKFKVEIELQSGKFAEELVIQTHLEAFSSRMNFLSKKEQEYAIKDMLNYLDTASLNSISINNTIKGILITENIVVLDKTERTLVSWIWISLDTNTIERELIRNSIKILLSRSKNKEIIAKVHLKNTRSINFFLNLGAEVNCIFLN